jgi:hypothetical protein
MKAPLDRRLDDQTAEQVRRSHAEAIREWQASAAAGLRVVRNIALVDGVPTPIAHGLGRTPLWAAPSAVRGASSTGRIDDVTGGSDDRAKVVTLKATGFGATITIDLAVL